METKKPSVIKTTISAIFVIVAFVVVFVVGLFMQPPRGDEASAFQEVLRELNSNHYQNPSYETLYEGAIQGAIRSLEDPYTRYFDAEAYARYREGFRESFVGVGITVENYYENVQVVTVWPDSPAEKAGLAAGDIITHVDGEDYRNRSYDETTAALVGEIDTEVEIGFQRIEGGDIIYVTMVRTRVSRPSVEGDTFMFEDTQYGYVRIHVFGDATTGGVQSLLLELEDEGIDGLIIDLRDNGGGNLSTLVGLLDIFLSNEASSKPFFTLEYYQDGHIQTDVYAGNTPDTKTYPITVLINERSASASEVFAAAMHEIGGHDLVGMPTFGKGTLQRALPMQSIAGNRLNVSIGQWFTPSGENVAKTGVIPTVSSKQNPLMQIMPLTVSAESAYRLDEVDETIARAQAILHALEYDVRTDGYFDGDTQAAIEAFQDMHDLNESGELDAFTAQALSESFRALQADFANDWQFQQAAQMLRSDDE